MTDIQKFRLPDAGEGLTEAEIVTWRVKPGDTVKINDPIVEIETAKSLVELPSPYAGGGTQLPGRGGPPVAVGPPITAVAPAPGGPPAPAAPPSAEDGSPPPATAPDAPGG